MRQNIKNYVQKFAPNAGILQHELDITVVTELPGGAKGDRTPDLGIANAALSQLSYRPYRISAPKPQKATPRQVTAI